MLDHYFEGITKLVVEHGGMVDKIVGDAVHALFNVPLDLDDHPRKAVDCAVAHPSPGPRRTGACRHRRQSGLVEPELELKPAKRSSAMSG